MFAHIARDWVWHFFSRISLKRFLQSHKTLAMTLPAENCTLNLFCLICLTVPI